MKKINAPRVYLCTAIVAFFMLSHTALAQVTMTADDAATTTSFNSSLHWSDSLAPHTGTNYLVASGRTLRTPEGGANYTFLGDSLTINNGFLNLKGTGNITIQDLRLYGCRIAMGIAGTVRVYGTNTIYGTTGTPSRYSGSNNRATYLYAQLQGSGEFQVERTATENTGSFVCRLYGTNTSFTGGITVTGADIKLGIDSTNAVGGELAGFRADALVLKDGATLYSMNPVTLASPTRGITINNGGIIEAAYANITLASPVTGTGDLTIKNPAFTTTLNSATTISGNIVADGGRLTFGPLFTLPYSSKIILKNSGTLQQSVSVTNDISLEGGKINAGTIGGSGSLTVSNVLFQSGAFEFDLSSNTNADFINISGRLTRPAAEKFVISLTKPVANESGTSVLMTVANMSDYTTNDFKLVSSYYNLPEGALEIVGNTLYFKQARPVVFLSAIDNNNGGSFTNGSCWSDGQVPNAANDYIVANGYRLRTAGSTTATVPFGGKSLTMAEGADLRAKGLRAYIQDLRLYNQRFTQGTPPDTQYIDGNISVLGPYDFENDGSLVRVLVIESPMSGTADIRFKISLENPTATYNGKFELRASNTNFTGGITLLGPNVTYLNISDENNLGGNPPVFRADQLNLVNTGILAVATSVTLDDPNRGIRLGGTGGILDVANSATLSVVCPINGSTLYKRGAGTLALSGVNSHTNGTMLTAGSLEARSANALGTGPVTFTTGTTCKVLVDATNMPRGARVADLLGTSRQVEPIFTAGFTPGVEIPLFLLTAASPTVTPQNITITNIPTGYVAEVRSKVVDDGGTPRTLLYTKYFIPATMIQLF